MKIDRQVIILCLLTAWLMGCHTTDENISTTSPNVILILADDLGYSDLGAYGGEIVTPNLDRLAEQGIKFTQFYNIAKCTQTRASVLTGLYHQQTDNLNRSDNNATLAELFDQAGYDTIISGKWHLGDWNNEKGTPMQRGFDHFFGFLGGAINYYTGEDWATGRNLMRRDTAVYDVPGDFYSTDNFTDYAIERITASRENNDPFFLYLSYNAPHFPLHVPREEIDKYRGDYNIGWDNLRTRRLDRMQQLGLVEKEWELAERDTLVPSWGSLTEKQQQEEQLLMAAYAGMVDRMDQQIGRLMAQLETLGIEDNTIVMFLSDNGGCPYDFNRTPSLPPGPATSARSYDAEWATASNTPFRKYKQWIHEGGISTPMIIRWPGNIKPGSMTHIPAHIVDIMPTLLDMADLEYPRSFNGNELLPLEGQSLRSVLQGEAQLGTRELFWEYNGSRAVREGAWKLVGERGGPWELYNMEQDRTEMSNVVETYPERAAEMSEKYDEWARRVGARSSRVASGMEPNKQDRYLYKTER